MSPFYILSFVSSLSANERVEFLSQNGKNQLAFAACALLAREKLFEQVEQIVQYYDFRRGSATTFTLSQKRFFSPLDDQERRNQL